MIRPLCRTFRRPLAPALCLAACAAALSGRVAPPARAAEVDPAERVWTQSWKEIAHSFIAWKGEYYSFPAYRKDCPSSALVASRRITEKAYAAAPALATLAQTYQDADGVEKKRTLRKDPGEIEAAVKALPDAKAGSYGWIRSGRVERAEGEDTIVLRKIQLLDTGEYQEKKDKMRGKLVNDDIAEYDAKVRAAARPRQHFEARNLIDQYRGVQMEAWRWWFAERNKAVERQQSPEFQYWEWRVVGFKASKVVAGQDWPAEKGVQLAVLEAKDHVVTAAPAAFLDKGMTEKEAEGLLEKVGLTKARFADLVKEARKRDEKNWLPLVLAAFENGGKLPDPPKKAVEAEKKPAPKGNDVELVK